MKNIVKKCLILVIVSLIVSLSFANTSIFAATVVPTDYTSVYTNTNNDITDEMDNNFGVFKFTNYGARFLKVTLTATSSQTVTYPNGAISVKNSDYQLVEKLNITGFDGYAILPFSKKLTLKIGKPISYELPEEEIVKQWVDYMKENVR